MKRAFLLIALLLVIFSSRAIALTFTQVVTNCSDSVSDVGSLRWAVSQANLAGGDTEIVFNISAADVGYATPEGSGLVTNEAGTKWFRIVTGSLIDINRSNIYIHGSTQTQEADNLSILGCPNIEIRGPGPTTMGLRIFNWNNCTIEGLTVNKFSQGIVMIGNYNQLLGSFIGTDATGEAKKQNGYGVHLYGAQYNKIGNGNIAGTGRNVISGNTNIGIWIDGTTTTADSNEVSGNYIGTNKNGTSALGNGSASGYSGIEIEGNATNGPQYNRIGNGTTPGRNVISGNNSYGIYIYNHCASNEVLRNYIGVAADGSTGLANVENGIVIQTGSSSNKIGNGAPTGRNVIAGNGLYGILIDGSSSNEIVGNNIGVAADNSTKRANSGYGIEIKNGAQFNKIGSLLTRYNIISGNGDAGVHMSDTGTDSNEVSGNYIGTNSSGAGTLGNSTYGIHLSTNTKYNKIGTVTGSDRNIISGNTMGILINNSSSYNTVQGNYIGVKPDGLTALANGAGVKIDISSQYNIIGSGTREGNNIISGNTNDGIVIVTSNSNEVRGNYIGLGSDGTTVVGGQNYGIQVDQGSFSKIIGNVVSGNSWNGIYLQSSGGTLTNCEIYGNYVGTDVTGSLDKGNGFSGIVVVDATTYSNTIGGSEDWQRNIFSGNGDDGIHLQYCNRNTITNNYIGVAADGNSALGNDRSGIYLWGNCYSDVISKNIIANNGALGSGYETNGISSKGDVALSYSETFSQNSIYNNTPKGIKLYGANRGIASAEITTASYETTSQMFRITGTATPNAVVEVFGAQGDQGKEYVGICTADAFGNWAGGFYAPGGIPAGSYVTATQKDALGDTSEFSLTREVTMFYAWQPDMMIGTLESGNDYFRMGAPFETTEALSTQEKTLSVATTGTAVFYFQYLNAGDGPDGLHVSAEAGSGGFTVRYFSEKTGTNEITANITGEGSNAPVIFNQGDIFEGRVEISYSGSGVATKEIFIMGTSTGDATKKDVVRASATFLPLQPDIMIGTLESGADYYRLGAPYDSTIADSTQIRTLSVATNETAVFHFKYINSAQVADGVHVSAEAGGGAFTVKYFETTGSTEITGLITGEGITAPLLFASGGSFEGWAEITYSGTSLATKEIFAIAASTGDATKKDVIIGRATFVPISAPTPTQPGTKEYTESQLGIPGMHITIPSGASTVDVTVTASVITTPPGDPPVGFSIGGKIISIQANVTQFAIPVTVTIPIDGPLAEPRVYYWDGTKWSTTGIVIVSYTNTSLTFTTTHFTIFAPMGAAANNRVRFGPNPYNPNNGSGRFWYWLDASKDTSIYLMDLGGTVVYKKAYSSGTNGAQAGENNVEYDGKTSWGDVLGNGAYLFKIIQDGKSVGGGKIAVIK